VRFRGRCAIPDEKPEKLVRIENERIRKRIAELEAELAESKRSGGSAPGQDRLLTLLKEKNRQLEESVAALEEKNEEITNNIAALRLYQLIFENEPAGLLGVDPSGRIIQFNSSAIRFFGVDLHHLRLEDVGRLGIEGVDVDLRKLFRAAIEHGESPTVEFEREGRPIYLSCFRLEDIRGCRGAVLRVSETKSE
jgi:PAS domain-containing protein